MLTRRQFMYRSAYLGAASVLSGFTKLSSYAQASSSSDYKAIFCFFLYGGNDTNNVLVPFDTKNYGMYSMARGALAIAQGQLLPLSGVPYAIHPQMPEVQQMFSAGELSFIANMGPLVTPTTMAQFQARSVPLPQDLLSHSDQRAIMQTASQSSSSVHGWGGGIVDALPQSYRSGVIPQAISYAGASTFIDGPNTPGFIAPSASGSVPCAEGGACTEMMQALKQIAACETSTILVEQEETLVNTGYKLNDTYADLIAQAPPLKTQFGSGAIQGQLSQIAKLLQVREAVGAQRQVFFIGMQSFDTHANQLQAHGGLLAELSAGIQTLRNMAQELNIWNSMVGLTLSDFNRTLQPNSTRGSDHAWGSHQIVFGGPVSGGNIFGTFPTLMLAGPDDIDGEGRLLPTTSLTQVGAESALWFGVPSSSLPQVFPNLANFLNPKIGFIKSS
jgi:uncharacterized protein (DUF1501 family)